MNGNWKIVRLEDVTTIIGDGLHGTPEYDEFGDYHFINGNNLQNGKIVITESTKKSSEHEYLIHKKNLNNRTILVSINGTLGNVAIYEGEKVFLGKSACYINVDENVDKYFVRYVISSNIFQDYIHSLATGSTIKNVSLKLMRNFEFYLPSLNEQQKISGILKSLDDKITLNRQINQTLEAMAQALFKSWFVDFEPVKAKLSALAVGGSADDANLAAMSAISGKTTEQLLALKTTHPDQFQQLYTTADLFPSEMVDSELGEIPKGWGVGKVGDIASFANGRISVGELNQNNYISTENMLVNKEGISSASSLPEIETTPSFQNGQILISNIRPYFKKIWLASFNGGRSGDVLAFDAKNKEQKEFLYNLLYQDSFFDYMMLTSKGAKMPRGDKTAIMNYKIAIPNKNMAEIYSSKVSEFYTQVNVLKKQNLVLGELRDTLLPKLLSGELLVDGVGE